MGISQPEIGAKMVAVGTSLSELAFGLVALKRGTQFGGIILITVYTVVSSNILAVVG